MSDFLVFWNALAPRHRNLTLSEPWVKTNKLIVTVVDDRKVKDWCRPLG
jgi:hypothetical protein